MVHVVAKHTHLQTISTETGSRNKCIWQLLLGLHRMCC